MCYSYEIFINCSLYGFLLSNLQPPNETALREVEAFVGPKHLTPMRGATWKSELFYNNSTQ